MRRRVIRPQSTNLIGQRESLPFSASLLLVMSTDLTEDGPLLACDYRYTVASELSRFLTTVGNSSAS